MTDHRIIDRLSTRYVETEDGCHIFIGHKDKDGYGIIRYDGPLYKAHRLVWMGYFGSIPLGMNILHACDNPSCINHRHLFVGTQQDNVNDMIAKGRDKFNNYANSRLNEIQIAEIKDLLSEGWTQQRIADKFKVNQSAISDIKTGRTWSVRT